MLNRFLFAAAPVSPRRGGRPGRLFAFAVLGLCVGVSSLASEFNPVRTEPATAAQDGSGRVIVKFRGTVAAPAADKATAASIAAQKVAALSGRSGITFTQARRLGPLLQVLEIAAPATSANVDAHLAILRADPDVEFAEPDLRRFPHAVPDDPAQVETALRERAKELQQLVGVLATGRTQASSVVPSRRITSTTSEVTALILVCLTVQADTTCCALANRRLTCSPK